jgi:hypothetical protein
LTVGVALPCPVPGTALFGALAGKGNFGATTLFRVGVYKYPFGRPWAGC